MPAAGVRFGWIVGIFALVAALASDGALAAPGAATSTTSPVGSYTRYTRRLEDEATRILTPEIGGAAKTSLAAHGLDLWGCQSISEWRQSVLRWAPTTDKALTVLVRRTEVLFADEQVDEPYGSIILQLGSVHAMQKGLSRVLEALGVAAPAPISASGLGSGTPAQLPTAPPMASPPIHRFPVDGYPALQSPALRSPDSATPELGSPDRKPVVPTPVDSRTAASSDAQMTHVMPPLPMTPPTPVPARTRTIATPVSPAQARNWPAAQSPFELAAYQGALSRESYRVLYPEIENGAQIALAGRRTEMRNATSVAAWKQLLSDANPAFAKAAAVLERRAEVLRGETKVLDPFESPHTQRAAVFGLQAGLEKILAQYGK